MSLRTAAVLASSLLVNVVLGCGSRQAGPGSGLDEVAATIADDCRGVSADGKVIVRKECIRDDVAVAQGVTLESLGNIAVATFAVKGTADFGDGREAVSKTHPDSMGLTDAVTRRLLDAGLSLVERDRRLTDQMLGELKYSASGLVSDASAPAIGQQLGARTLLVGRYEFSGRFEKGSEVSGDLVLGKPIALEQQSIRVKAIDISAGRVLVDAEFKLPGRVTRELMPRVLARHAIKVVLEKLRNP